MGARRLTITIEWGLVKPTKQPKATETAARVDTVNGRATRASRKQPAGFRAPTQPRADDEGGA